MLNKWHVWKIIQVLTYYNWSVMTYSGERFFFCHHQDKNKCCNKEKQARSKVYN